MSIRKLIVAGLFAFGLLPLVLFSGTNKAQAVSSAPYAYNYCLTLAPDSGTAVGGFVVGRSGITVQNNTDGGICFGYNTPDRSLCPSGGVQTGSQIPPGSSAAIPLGYQSASATTVYAYSQSGTADGGVCVTEVR